MTKEIVTIQIGTGANYVGAHFWNLQDEKLANPVLREDLSPAALFCEIAPSNRAYASGLRYAPRLQIIDASGAFGALSTSAGIVLPSSTEDPSASAWHGQNQLVHREHIPRSKYIRNLNSQEADAIAAPTTLPRDVTSPPLDDINFWTDYLKVRLHPRTCFQLPGVHHQVSNLDHFATGEELTKPLLEDLYDDLRHFAEDCDCLGGVNVVANADDAFSGISAAYLDHIVEELGSSLPLLVFGNHSIARTYTKQHGVMFGTSYNRDVELRLSANEAQIVAKCMDYSAEYIPMAPQLVRRIPNLHVDMRDPFQASAALGLALDVALIPIQQHLSLSGLVSSIRPMPFANVGSIACNLPSKLSKKISFGRSFFETIGTVDLSAASSRFVAPVTAKPLSLRSSECISARGIGYPLPIYCNLQQPVTLPIPFPSIFDVSHYSSYEHGKVLSSHQQGGVLPEEIAMVAGLGTVPGKGKAILRGLGESIAQTACHKTINSDETETIELEEKLHSRSNDYGSI